MSNGEWLFGPDPVTPGWYAVLRCWDAQEGIFTGAAYYGESGWPGYEVVAYMEPVQKSQLAAIAYASDNDPDNG